MPVPSLKRVKIHVEGLHSTRLKEEKASKSKQKKGTGKASLKSDLDKVNICDTISIVFYAEKVMLWFFVRRLLN